MENFRKEIAAVVVAMMAFASVSAWACTGLLVGKKASIDGSTMISYAADSHTLYGALYYKPAADHQPGDVRKIVDWDTSKPLGEIAEVAHTYAVVGNMNEHQLSITESTFGGREELADTTGIIDYGTLIRLGLERARTAREAIKVMTSLVAEYGYCSEGESFSIADPNEVWVMEMMGKGGKEKGAVWVAIRIPDDCISAHANQSRIHKIPFSDKENCMYSKDVVSFARKMGLYTGSDEDFSFSKVYCPADWGTLRGCDARAWAFFNKFKKGMEKYLPYIDGKKDAEVMPLYVKPDRKLSVQDVQNMMRDHFEGTPFDMTLDNGATAHYGVPYRWRPMSYTVDDVKYINERAIATQQTGFVLVSQMRSWLPDEVGGIHWFGVDDANTAVFVPFYCCINEVPKSYNQATGDMLTFSWDAAFWVNNWVANQAYHKYSYMIEDIRKVQGDIENGFAARQAEVEAEALRLLKTDRGNAVQYLTSYSSNAAEDATARYRKLGEFLLVKYIDGNVKKEKDGKFSRTQYGEAQFPSQPGYSEDYYRHIAHPNLIEKEVEK